MSSRARDLRFLVLGLWLLLPGCRGQGELGSVVSGFRLEPEEIDFGRVLESSETVRQVRIINIGRSDLTLTFEVAPPFRTVSSLPAAAGASVAVDVVLVAPNGNAEGRLRVNAASSAQELRLHGLGIRPLPCRPSSPCHIATFDLQSSRCIERVAENGARCIPVNACLENGVCRDAVCLGTPRSCDDNNRCTIDSCSPSQGCIHTPVVCPPAQRPCRISTCVPAMGCGEAVVSDYSVCGSVNCSQANLCISGECRAMATPEGFLCAPASPCQGEGHCRAGNCVRPDAGVLLPRFSASVAYGPSDAPEPPGALRAMDGNLYFEACEDPAGCRLTSFTRNGFLRYSLRHADRRPRELVLVDPAAIVVTAGDSVEAYDPANGSPLWSVDRSALVEPDFTPEIRASQIGQASNGDVIAAVRWRGPEGGEITADDSGSLVRIRVDSGVVLHNESAPVAARVALDENDELYLYDLAGPVHRARFVDGGYQYHRIADIRGSDSLVAIGSRLLVGGTELIDADGGQVGRLVPLDQGSSATLVLAARSRGYAFYRGCPQGPPCNEGDQATLLRSTDLNLGSLRWEIPVLPPGGGFVSEASLIADGGICVLSQSDPADAGHPARIQLFAEDQELFSCPIPSSDRLGPNTFDRGFVYVLARRGSAWFLDAYDLSGLTAERSGWGVRDASRGAKRAVP